MVRIDSTVTQALMHAPAGGALSEQQFVLNDQSPITELDFVSAMQGAIDVPQGTVVAQVELRNALNTTDSLSELRDLIGRFFPADEHAGVAVSS